MKLALVQDQLLTQGGSERIFLYMAQEFREAEIFTLAYNADTTLPEFREFDIRTTWADAIVRDHHMFKTFFPIGTRIMEHLDLRGFDMILTSSATIAKYVRRLGGPHVCYCYFPTRAIWTNEQYFDVGSRGLKTRLFHWLLPYFKRRDRAAAALVDHFVAISESSRQGIQHYYERDAEVVFSPIDVKRFRAGLGQPRGEHFLIVSRLERWKQLDYAIKAFTETGLPLRIIGQGSDESWFRSMAGPNIEFVGGVDDDQLVREYAQARAVVFTPELEYGLVPVEAVAAGTPVIALGRGGVLETMVGVEDATPEQPATAVLYPDPTVESLTAALARFPEYSFDPQALTRQADRFDIPEFQSRMREIVEREYRSRQD